MKAIGFSICIWKKFKLLLKNLFLGWPFFVENVRKSIFNIKPETEVCQVWDPQKFEDIEHHTLMNSSRSEVWPNTISSV